MNAEQVIDRIVEILQEEMRIDPKLISLYSFDVMMAERIGKIEMLIDLYKEQSDAD